MYNQENKIKSEFNTRITIVGRKDNAHAIIITVRKIALDTKKHAKYVLQWYPPAHTRIEENTVKKSIPSNTEKNNIETSKMLIKPIEVVTISVAPYAYISFCSILIIRLRKSLQISVSINLSISHHLLQNNKKIDRIFILSSFGCFLTFNCYLKALLLLNKYHLSSL